MSGPICGVRIETGEIAKVDLHFRLLLPYAVVERLVANLSLALQKSEQQGLETIALELLPRDILPWSLEGWEQLPAVKWSVLEKNMPVTSNHV